MASQQQTIVDPNEICEGCLCKLTLENIGGYQCFCDKCVAAMPSLPGNGGYFIEGMYPNFKWVESNDIRSKA